MQQFAYDANGNLLSINTGTKAADGKLQATNSRRLLWDENNYMLASSDNGFVTNYFYDAAGERTVKMSGESEGVQVNGVLSAGRTGTTNFTAYISPYLVVNSGGEYTKHIYIGSQRITSKVGNSGLFATSPVNTTDLQAKYATLTAKIKERFDSLGVMYKGTQQTGGLISKVPGTSSSSYFYHSDHLGSSSLITDQSGGIIQHIEYVPFGETFIDERRSQSSWNTPYLFSGKERDAETGLLYFGARYQDSKYGIWYSVDPLAEKYPGVGSYVYCLDNPVRLIDPDGRKVIASKLSGDQAKAFVMFAKTEEGKAFLDKYASKGQKLAYKGEVFYQSNAQGKYDKKGVDLIYKMGDNETGSGTCPSKNQSRYNVTIEIAKNGFGSNNKLFNLVKAIAHESFLHADFSANDILDGKRDFSSVPNEYRQYEVDADHYYVGWEYLANPNNKDVKSFPVNGLDVLRQTSRQLKLNYSDTKIKSIMWDFEGSLVNVNKNGNLYFNNNR